MKKMSRGDPLFGFILLSIAWLTVFIYALKAMKDYLNSRNEEKTFEKDFVIKLVGAVCLSGFFVIAEVLRMTNIGLAHLKGLFLMMLLLFIVAIYIIFTYQLLFPKHTIDRNKGWYTFQYKYRKWIISIYLLLPIGVVLAFLFR